ncbi:MAG: DUF4296 domain-containing protein [Bacteroidota bacterium]|jgi:hypothetical protein
MVKSAIGLLALVLGLSACGGSAEPANPSRKPKDLIPREEFTELLTEMHLIEGARGGEHLMGDSLAVWKVYRGTFARMGYSPEQVQRSYTYYHTDPKLAVELYEDVMARLKERTQDLSKPLAP